MFPSSFSENRLVSIEKVSLDHQFMQPTLPQPLVSRRPSTATERTSQALVFAVTSGKGGVGKTNVVANLAAALAQRQKRVMVIDADLGLANLDIFLGVRPVYTLADFFTGLVSLNEIVIQNRNGILLLPGAFGAPDLTALRHDQKIALLTELDALNHEIDLVLIDTSSGVSDAVTYFATSAQEIVVVVTPEASSITDAYALVKVLAFAHKEKRFRILANDVSGEGEALHLFDALSRSTLRFLNTSLDFFGWVPSDPQLARAAARSELVVTEASNAPSAMAFAVMAERLIEISSARGRVKGNAQFFFRRMLERSRTAK